MKEKVKKKMRRKSNKIKTIISISISLAFIFAYSGVSFSQEKIDNSALKKQIKNHCKEGYAYYKKKMYEEAIAEYEKALALDGKNKATQRLINKSKKMLERKTRLHAKKREQAERKQAIKHLKKGKYYYRKKMYGKAIEEFQKAFALHPKNKTTQKLIYKTEKKLKRGKRLAAGKRTESKRYLTLDECIEIAMENHMPLQIGKKQLKLAKFRLLEAQRKLGPSWTFKFEEETGKVDGRYYEARKVAVEGKQPIFYGGELVFAVQQASVNVEIVENDYERIKNELILQVKKGYYSLDKAKKALRIQKELKGRTENLYNMAKSGYEAGMTAQVEFLKASSQHNQTNFQLVSAKEDISIANLLLQQAMNINEEINIVEPEEPKIIELSLEKCYDLAYWNRPELKISELSLEYFQFEKKIMSARSNWPRVDFLGSYGRKGEKFVEGDRDDTKDFDRGMNPEWYAGLKVGIPFWGNTLGYSITKEQWAPVVRTKHQTASTVHAFTAAFLDKLDDVSGAREADLEYMRSLEEMNKKKQEITLEVKETFFKYKRALLLMEVAKSKVAFQSKQTEIIDIRRELGEAQFSDVIEELVKLAEEKFSYAQAIADYFMSIAMLNKAIGIDNYFKI